MWVRDLTDPLDAAHVVANMRQRDRQEIMALRWHDSTDREIVEGCVRSLGWVMGLGAQPIAIIGAIPRCPGIWSAWMMATDDFQQIRFSMTRWVRRVMIPRLKSAPSIRVVECFSIAGYGEIHRWLLSLGATKSAPLEDFGKGGETFHRFHRVLRPR